MRCYRAFILIKMNDLKEFFEKYAKENNQQVIGVNMYVWSHNDMLDFAAKYFEKKVNDYLEKEKIKLMGNS